MNFIFNSCDKTQELKLNQAEKIKVFLKESDFKLVEIYRCVHV